LGFSLCFLLIFPNSSRVRPPENARLSGGQELRREF
jgi:hypothetical protein